MFETFSAPGSVAMAARGGAPLTTRQAMAVGTAGYTAMLCVMALERHGIAPGDGEILVTGAAGGVGSVAVALLSKLGYRVAKSRSLRAFTRRLSKSRDK